MINTKWINSAHNCEAYNSFETVYSDHRIITATFKLSFRENKKITYNWSLLYINKDLQKKFYTDFKRKFDNYTKDINNCNTMYQAFSKTTLETEKENIPLKHKLNKRVPWENNKISEKRDTLSECILLKEEHPIPTI